MPIYVLHGGAANRMCESNRDFHAEVASHVKTNGKILMVYFAADEGDWDRKYKLDQRNFSSFDVNLEMAKVETFEAQLKSADAVYFRDGYTDKLFEIMEKFDVELLKKEMVYVGSSAGANLFCHKCYSAPIDDFVEGKGVVPFHLLIHANNENYAGAKPRLKEQATAEIPFLPLSETKFVTLEF